jgi:hypothetical protein
VAYQLFIVSNLQMNFKSFENARLVYYYLFLLCKYGIHFEVASGELLDMKLTAERGVRST